MEDSMAGRQKARAAASAKASGMHKRLRVVGRRRGRGDRSSNDLEQCVELVAMAILALSLFPAGSAYGEREFLAAYKDPTVSRHEVMGDVILLASLPVLSRDLTLVGVKGRQGKLPVIDGQSRYTGINLTDPARGEWRVTLTNLEFRNLRSNDLSGGAAVYVQVRTRLQIDGCVFRGNKAVIGGGGAITVDEESSYRITNCLFDGNQAQGRGGAFVPYTDAGGVINRTTFKNNYANERGGAISVNPGELRIDRCTFQGNKENGGGGGGAVDCFDGTCIVYNTLFSRNVAKGKGGGLNAIESDVGGGSLCRGNTFSGNKAAADARSNNVYVQVADDTEPVFKFCDRTAPADTLINAPPGSVVLNDCGYC
ncbi:hypothetical protein CBR_g36245 [Chara braunii]|uniref:Right handed beta helix domain-containing protein n=1 Tax=Chara braunii TaxID=69332 RepID=A0A388LKB5_CHABU|nr:hypothetical protein CBR_g36245 [Chara braunii]|eukprot:GBG82717.1 hypothetical protein CBR_g36245 [Chara braunii]